MFIANNAKNESHTDNHQYFFLNMIFRFLEYSEHVFTIFFSFLAKIKLSLCESKNDRNFPFGDRRPERAGGGRVETRDEEDIDFAVEV